MKVLYSNFTKVLAIILLVLVSFIITKAQDKKEEPLKSKLDQIKGKVEKITVKVDGKDVVFEGKEAERLVERFKAGRIEKRIRITDGDDIINENGNKPDGEKKKVTIEISDGKKIVTVTTTKDGKDEVKVFEGEDAEKYLRKEEHANHMRIMTDDEDMPMPHHRGMMMRMDDEDGCCCCCHRHRMPPPLMHRRKIMIKHVDKNCMKNDKGMDKDCKSMDKEIDKNKDPK